MALRKGRVKKRRGDFLLFRGSYREDLIALCRRGSGEDSQLNKSGNEAISSSARRKKFCDSQERLRELKWGMVSVGALTV